MAGCLPCGIFVCEALLAEDYEPGKAAYVNKIHSHREKTNQPDEGSDLTFTYLLNQP